MMKRVVLVVALALPPSALFAQWLDFRTPGIPRTADGKPDLAAPAPRTPDGKPDFSGTWSPETNPYRFDLIADPRDESVFRTRSRKTDVRIRSRTACPEAPPTCWGARTGSCSRRR